jgi:hypothetical protein
VHAHTGPPTPSGRPEPWLSCDSATVHGSSKTYPYPRFLAWARKSSILGVLMAHPTAKPTGKGGGRSPPPFPVGFVIGRSHLDPQHGRFPAPGQKPGIRICLGVCASFSVPPDDPGVYPGLSRKFSLTLRSHFNSSLSTKSGKAFSGPGTMPCKKDWGHPAAAATMAPAAATTMAPGISAEPPAAAMTMAPGTNAKPSAATTRSPGTSAKPTAAVKTFAQAQVEAKVVEAMVAAAASEAKCAEAKVASEAAAAAATAAEVWAQAARRLVIEAQDWLRASQGPEGQ